jgi:hypothetical protein
MRPSSARGRIVQDIIKLIYAAIGSESTWRFVLVIGIGFGLVTSVGAGGLAWLIDKGYKKSQAETRQQSSQAELIEAPYVILEYLTQSNGHSGFYISNSGRQNAVQVQISDIRVGNKIATFGELPSIRNDGQKTGTYSTGVPLEEVLNDLADKTILPSL